MSALNHSAMFLFAVIGSSHTLVLILVTAIVQWLLGAFWYGVMFRKTWRKLVGFAEGEKPKNAALTMVASFVACFVLTFVLAHVIGWAGSNSFTGGAELGAVCWFGFIAPPLITQHIAENRRVNLCAINATYWLLVMMIGGGMMAGL